VLSRAAVQTPDQPSPALSLSRPLLVLTRSRRAVQEKYQLVLQLTNPDTREGALLELSKRRESFGDLAPILWHSFGTMAALLQEIVSIYPLLSPPSLVRKRTARAARRSLSLSLSLLSLLARALLPRAAMWRSRRVSPWVPRGAVDLSWS
jgi:hypothetical protein